MPDTSDDQDAFRLPIDGLLDLHAFLPGDVKSIVEEYVTDAC